MANDGFDFDALVRGGYPLRRFEPEERIFTQEDEGSTMYVVRSGQVAIMSGGAVLDTIGPGGTFGEMALIDGSPRSATAIAREPTEAAVIDERAFLYLVERNPGFALDLLRRLARRLRRMNDSL
ncbi:MAG: cyclic nucleotide-binding domain-containing protein [Hyphomicrobium sp.]|uniref:cyclic nucleotide-binding domain-containing protein n=1 Tax=Hyphomicrobium sp. TaxID=82 RepID=UPI00132958E7|nr:cyclic nucleotide-binding domain-containing protein [Hyphomicrobium sp.]KAB2940390.1 MAG: cyclic nucleotide-binding domain-containing protein [Hyphomicrobium sp.]MBZ0209116.1 cyclic nucleotide-binding domain-containing protein [Hyphomicrobium sp.]MCZ7595719.1 cyclic nucleotide-binding domain-containing protein [Hyphomicrobium sp.]